MKEDGKEKNLRLLLLLKDVLSFSSAVTSVKLIAVSVVCPTGVGGHLAQVTFASQTVECKNLSAAFLCGVQT